jgi:hypothetical protein
VSEVASAGVAAGVGAGVERATEAGVAFVVMCTSCRRGVTPSLNRAVAIQPRRCEGLADPRPAVGGSVIRR